MSFSIQQYPKLKEAIEKNNLVLFVGAGTSLNLINSKGEKIGNWNTLIQNILSRLKNNGHDVNHLEKSLKTSSPLEVLDELEQFYNDIEKNSIYEFTNHYFNIDKDKNDLEFQKKLFSLSSKIISTNYDKAFEIACPTLEQNNKIILRGNSAKIERLKHENEFLLKLHGCYSHENTMVLFNCDYQNLYENDNNVDSQHLLTFLSNLFYNKTILFVGYGMGDDEINLIFDNIQKVTNRYSQKHFIISKDKIKEQLKTFLIPIPVNDHPEIPEIIDSLIATKQNYEEEKQKEIQKQLDSLSNDSKNNKHEKLINELFEEALEFSNALNHEKAIKKYEQIISLGEYPGVYNNWGASMSDLSNLKTSKEKEELLLGSCKKFEKATQLDENYPKAFYNWGNSIFDLSNLKTGNEKEVLLLDCCKKYEKAIKLDEKYSKAFNNWGNSISNLSNLKTGKEKEDLLLESCKKYQKAIELDENDSDAFYNWGNSLSDLSNLKTEKEKEDLLLDSFKKYEKAIELDENHFKAFYNWGNSLSDLSNLKTGKEKEELLLDCCKKYEKTIEFDENNSDAFYNWGNSLMKIGIARVDENQRKEKFQEAEKVFLKGISIGGQSYNLACLYALQKNKNDALKYLDIVLKNNEVTSQYVFDDEDWKSFKEDQDFLNLLKKYKSN